MRSLFVRLLVPLMLSGCVIPLREESSAADGATTGTEADPCPPGFAHAREPLGSDEEHAMASGRCHLRQPGEPASPAIEMQAGTDGGRSHASANEQPENPQPIHRLRGRPLSAGPEQAMQVGELMLRRTD